MYFTNINNDQDLKRKYKELCLKLHPDRGGSHEAFVNMKSEYDSIVRRGFRMEGYSRNSTPPEPTYYWSAFDDFIRNQAGSFYTEWKKEQDRDTQQERAREAEARRREEIRKQEEQKRKAFDSKIEADEKFKPVIKYLFTNSNRSHIIRAILALMRSIPDLELDHFRYVKNKLGLSNNWMIQSFADYRTYNIKSKERWQV